MERLNKYTPEEWADYIGADVSEVKDPGLLYILEDADEHVWGVYENDTIKQWIH